MLSTKGVPERKKIALQDSIIMLDYFYACTCKGREDIHDTMYHIIVKCVTLNTFL